MIISSERVHGCVCSCMVGHCPGVIISFGCVSSVSCQPTQTGLCKFGWVWSSLIFNLNQLPSTSTNCPMLMESIHKEIDRQLEGGAVRHSTMVDAESHSDITHKYGRNPYIANSKMILVRQFFVR